MKAGRSDGKRAEVTEGRRAGVTGGRRGRGRECPTRPEASATGGTGGRGAGAGSMKTGP